MKRKIVVSLLIGAVSGIAIGYIAYAIGHAPRALALTKWLTGSSYPDKDTWIDALLWGLGGAAVAASLQYILGRNSN